jgi:hypothetical protein
MRVGGPVPLGYVVQEKKLVPCPTEAEQVRLIFARYLELGCLTALARELRELGITTKVSPRRDGSVRGGIPFTKGPLAYLLRNRVYIGQVIQKGRHYPGEHEPIVPAELFEAVQQALSAKAASEGHTALNRGSLLKGLLYDDQGNRMSPSTAKKSGARYRYYVSTALAQGRHEDAGSVTRVPAPEIEAAVLKTLAVGLDSAPEHESAAQTVAAERLAGLDRIILRQNAIEIVPRAVSGEDAPMPILVLWTKPPIRRRRQIIGASTSHSRPIRAETRARLVEGIAKARLWVDELLSGKVSGTEEIAKRQGCSERSVRMTLNLAFLAPEIVEATVAGTLPDGFGTSKLTEMPLGWGDQTRACQVA